MKPCMQYFQDEIIEISPEEKYLQLREIYRHNLHIKKNQNFISTYVEKFNNIRNKLFSKTSTRTKTC